MKPVPKAFKNDIRWLLEEKYRGKETPAFSADISRLIKGEPLAYVIGFIPFLDAHIDLSYRPLIPRAETEYWVSEIIPRIKKAPGTKILDLFSGSGAIGIALALHTPVAHVSMGEKDAQLVKQIRKNIRLNRLDVKKVRAYQSDVFSRIPRKKFSYIFANPPYVPLKHSPQVQKSVKRWEPHKAVFARDNGMSWIKKLITESPKYLEDQGMLFIEFDPSQKKPLEQYARQNGFRHVRFYKDQHKKWRFVELGMSKPTA